MSAAPSSASCLGRSAGSTQSLALVGHFSIAQGLGREAQRGIKATGVCQSCPGCCHSIAYSSQCLFPGPPFFSLPLLPFPQAVATRSMLIWWSL